MINYVPLHVHSHFSLMDGVATPEEYVARAVELEMPAMALTDHGTLTGHRDFHREAVKAGIKPIFGIEAYFTPDRFDRRKRAERTQPLDKIYNHLLIVAKNDAGYRNLNKMNEIAWVEGFHSKPRMDWELFERYNDGLIVGSACMGGPINQAIEQGELGVAKEYAVRLHEIFGSDFYIEVMPHNVPGMNAQLIKLADSLGIKAIVTPDCHHADVSQKTIQEIMLIANTHPKTAKYPVDPEDEGSALVEATFQESLNFEDPADRLDYLYGKDRMLTFNKFDIHLLSGEEMWRGMGEDAREDMFENTFEILDQIEDYTVPHGMDLLPVEYREPAIALRKDCEDGLKEKGLWTPEYIARLDEEMKVISDKGFDSYFLVVGNTIDWARSKGIRIGPGRGSGAGSLVCYAKGITDIDPIKHGLLFFRFINPERNDFPDVDIDIEDRRRPEVKQYLIDQYRFVASIATFNVFKDKGVIRDVARVFQIPLPEVNKVLKNINTWDEFLESSSTMDFRLAHPEVVKYAAQLRGRIRGTGVHASGVVASKIPLSDIAPIEVRKISGTVEELQIVAVDMDEAADIGLIKLDFLGLKALAVIQDTLATIKDRQGLDIDLNQIDMEDENIYRMLSNGHTMGVFQCEAAPYTALLVKMGVHSFADLAATNALVRPGAANTIGKDYIARKNGQQGVTYPHVDMRPFTEETYGCILYQEQVMLTCTTIGGMTMSEADRVRKIIGKKKDVSEFKPYEDKFLANAAQAVGQDTAEKLWHDFEAHAGYSFNKSHAVAYSTVSYWTAWLKFYYPLEFMWATLRNEGDKNSRTQYLIEAKRLGIPVMLPHINQSGVDFEIQDDGIRIGLSAIKYLSDKSAERYIEARPFADYKSVESFTFTKGSGVNSRALSSMNAIGALTFPDNPVNTAKVKANLYEFLNLPEMGVAVPPHWPAFMSSTEEFDEAGAFIIMGIVTGIKLGKGWSRIEIMDKSGTIGVFHGEDTDLERGKSYLFLIGSNRIVESVPLSQIEMADSGVIDFLNRVDKLCEDDELFVLNFQPRKTKKGDRMGTLILSNSQRELLSMVVFPRQFSQAFIKLDPGKAYKLNYAEGRDGGLVFNGIER